jgi:hypothetical protein
MVQSAKKTPVSTLIPWAVMVLATSTTLAEIQLPVSNELMQPHAFNQLGLHALRQVEPGLTGSNVSFAVICRSQTYVDGQPQNDHHPNVSHNCFADTTFIFHDALSQPVGISPHATAVCSILFGQDPNASHPTLGRFRYQGIAPNADAHIYEFWQFLINNVFFQVAPNAQVLTASMGNPFEDWWTRGIDAMAEHSGLIVVAGIGNGANAYDPPLYPGASANVIGVGVVTSVSADDLETRLANFALAYPQYSSSGPTANKRCKPDIVAPANCLVADANSPDRYQATGDWSSYSTPIVAGTVGLLVQKAQQHPALADAIARTGGNCVLRAILLNSATKLPFWHKGRLETDDDHSAPLDYVQGAGMLNALGAYIHLISGRHEPGDAASTGWDNNTIHKQQRPQAVYRMTVTQPTDMVISATLVWNRHFGTAYPFDPQPSKNTNLRLELWAIDPNNTQAGYLLDYSDSTADNVEHIFCRADPNCTVYELVVSFSPSDVPGQAGVAERYGLAWNITDRRDTASIFWYDLNADGSVDSEDSAILIDYLSKSRDSNGDYLLGDINGDGLIDLADVEILISHASLRADWHKPEPGESR